MARGIPATTVVAPIPKVSFTKVENEGSTQPAGVHDLQARSYGYNDFSEFKRPEHYIRFIEPLESELAVQVEYDMDEQDQEWLDMLNAERKKEQLNKVSYETFEIVMDRLEKEWFDLTKNIPKPDLALPSEDSTCAICDDSEGENSNAIVFCDGCNLAVHQDCYGVPYIPEGQWLCRKCTVSPEIPVSCILCPNEGGAFKQTVLGEWVHLLCAIWVPETRVANEVFMEPVTGIEKISKQRWKLKCSICDIREGACIQCAKTSCFLAFHATCARKEKFLMPMKSTQGTEPTTLTSFCEKHLPKEQLAARTAALAAEEDGDGHGDDKLSKSARAYAKTYKTGPPLVPALIVDRIMTYIGKVTIRKKAEFILMVCKYWSLKREARRGAPLLKRLHLEPWTASTGNKLQSQEDLAMKLEQLQLLRKDLESVRTLVELSRKRETRKLRQAEITQDILGRFLFAHEPPLRMAFERIISHDRNDYFKNPVSKTEVPDYFEIVRRPMCWSIIDAKLDRHEYWDMYMFENDVFLVLDNAVLYNKPGTPFYKTATKIHALAKPILGELRQQLLPTSNPAQPLRSPGELVNGLTESTSYILPSIGDLEPSLEILRLLTSPDIIKDDLDLILNDEPIASLFNYEIAQPKPPPPSPPPPPPKLPKASKSRKSDKGRKGKSGGQDMLDASPGFRAPRTRQAVATEAAFHAEIDAEESLAESSSSALKKSKKRPSHVLPGHSELPPMVDHIDDHGSFKMFDAGWILPPNQRRGGRAPVERQPLPPPKKRPRIDRGMSRLSIFSTAASENQTLQIADENSERKGVDDHSGDIEMTVEHTDTKQPQVVNISKGSGVTVIEELDTPATRREKNLRRKAEKNRAVAETPEAPPLNVAAARSPAAQSDMSSLSSLGTDEEEEEVVVAPIQPKPLSPVPERWFVKEDIELEPGTLVWAKADTYPWWPAVVFDFDDVAVPWSVITERKEKLKKHRAHLHCVHFFDKGSTWQCLPSDRLKLLGEDGNLDQDLLAPNSRQQRWKNPSLRESCRQAFRDAIAEMETPSDVEEEVVEGKNPT